VDRTYTKRDIDSALRRMSVSEGLRTFLNIDGAEEAIHCSDMTDVEADLVERVKQRFADEHGLWLTEYDETVNPPVPYRSVGGRSRAEMESLKA
jgi:predicted amidohydrolase